MKVASISDEGLNLIAKFEGLRLEAYLDTGGVPTIGVGTTRYPNRTRVKMGDRCTKEQAIAWLRFDISSASKDIDDLVRDDITQHQFDALVSLVYNIGRSQFSTSTVRRLVNVNPSDAKIRNAFKMWIKDDGRIIQGLLNRRIAEADLYFS